MLKPLCILIFSFGLGSIFAQDPVLHTSEFLRSNIVRITVSFSDESKQYGFGFITGENNGLLYLATAAHVVHGEAFNQHPTQIQVWFYSDLLPYSATAVTFFESLDVAILQLNKPATFEYQSESWADFSPQTNQVVRFVGRNQEWQTSAQGEIYKIENERIYAYMPTVRPGTSGAPLISEKGIVGLIIEDDNQDVTAISLGKIRELFTQRGRFPYFGVVRTRISPDPDIAIYKMVKIEGGTYRMGCIETRDDSCFNVEIPDHEVNINSFYISKHEVTNEEFVKFLNTISNEISLDINADRVTYQNKVIFGLFCGGGKGSCPEFKAQIEYSAGDYPGGNFNVVPGYEQYPVVLVSKYGADAYCRWLSSMTNKTYRLPTEAEWEFAARGGISSKRYKYSGSNILDHVSWFYLNSDKASHLVGQKKPNEIGLYDMSGNVWEWCADWYDRRYYARSPNSNPIGPDNGLVTVLRGGCSGNREVNLRVATRVYSGPGSCDIHTGFRLARNF